MTGPEDSPSGTRPISVAELLARNGTIGAPPVGGRRRRRRRDSDAVTVAELTGEIPIVTVEASEEAPQLAGDEDPYVEVTGPVPGNGLADHADADTDYADADTHGEVDTDYGEVDTDYAEVDTDEADVDTDAETDVDTDYADVGTEADLHTDEADVETDYADAVADYTAYIEHRDVDPAPLDFSPRPRRPHYAHAARRYQPPAAGGAEEMSPDPVIDDEVVEDSVDVEATVAEDADEPPSYERSSESTLFGGHTVADDLARRGGSLAEDTDLEYLEDLEDDVDVVREPASKMSMLVHGAWIVGQCVIAVAFGAGLFVAFDQLWKWNNIVALVLSVLVILGLVVGVRVVRKTEDIGSTLIAVAVGALVTLGPLALLQSG